MSGQPVDLSADPVVVRAAGGIVWTGTGAGRRVALVHRPKYGDWSLPKGKLRDGESWIEAAAREVREETGCRVQLREFAGILCYLVKGRPKVILFWNMDLLGKSVFEPNEEVDRIEWLRAAEAMVRLDHWDERKLLDQNRGR